MMQSFANHVPQAIDEVMDSLPEGFSDKVATSITSNVLRLHARLCKEVGK
ncbi:phosphatidylinositol kinase [Enterobacter cancerogenus]|nr:phosphatidylinositol kinase [Enterobacter cancerogenus]